jgi:hypothetical protein
MGSEMEANFEKDARAAGFTEKEIKSAYNKNMMAGGLLSVAPAAFAEQYKRRWMVTNYEAGDIVLHSCFMVELFYSSIPSQKLIFLRSMLPQLTTTPKMLYGLPRIYVSVIPQNLMTW